MKNESHLIERPKTLRESPLPLIYSRSRQNTKSSGHIIPNKGIIKSSEKFLQEYYIIKQQLGKERAALRSPICFTEEINSQPSQSDTMYIQQQKKDKLRDIYQTPTKLLKSLSPKKTPKQTSIEQKSPKGVNFIEENRKVSQTRIRVLSTTATSGFYSSKEKPSRVESPEIDKIPHDLDTFVSTKYSPYFTSINEGQKKQKLKLIVAYKSK